VHGYGEDQRLKAGDVARHRHRESYAAIVLEGSYLEVGDNGCWRAEAGSVIAHGAFEAHRNWVSARGARVINLALPVALDLPAAFRVRDIDALIDAARAGTPDIRHLLLAARPCAPVEADWPALLAEAIRRCPTLSIGRWAAHAGLARETISRGFRATFGTTPARYRAEARARHAWRQIVGGRQPLSAIAYDGGFADQAHFTRAVHALTGAPPSSWRRVKSVQDRVEPLA
jgi:AraC-like DNA-binding protein